MLCSFYFILIFSRKKVPAHPRLRLKPETQIFWSFHTKINIFYAKFQLPVLGVSRFIADLFVSKCCYKLLTNIQYQESCLYQIFHFEAFKYYISKLGRGYGRWLLWFWFDLSFDIHNRNNRDQSFQNMWLPLLAVQPFERKTIIKFSTNLQLG